MCKSLTKKHQSPKPRGFRNRPRRHRWQRGIQPGSDWSVFLLDQRICYSWTSHWLKCEREDKILEFAASHVFMKMWATEMSNSQNEWAVSVIQKSMIGDGVYSDNNSSFLLFKILHSNYQISANVITTTRPVSVYCASSVVGRFEPVALSPENVQARTQATRPPDHLLRARICQKVVLLLGKLDAKSDFGLRACLSVLWRPDWFRFHRPKPVVTFGEIW